MKINRYVKKGLLCLAFAGAALGIDMALRIELTERKKLTEQQVEKLTTVFGNSVDYSKVTIAEGPMTILQGPNTYKTWKNTIYIPRNGSIADLDSTKILFHEINHIWQHQNKVNNCKPLETFALWWTNWPYKKAYAYDINQYVRLSDYNHEQQSDIVEDYFKLRDSLYQKFDGWQKNGLPYDPDSTVISDITRCYKMIAVIEKDIPQYAQNCLQEMAALNVFRRDERIALQKQSDNLGIPDRANALIAKAGDERLVVMGGFRGRTMRIREKTMQAADFKIHYSTYLDSGWSKDATHYSITYKDKEVYRSSGDKVILYKPGAWECDFGKLSPQLTATIGTAIGARLKI